MFKILLVLSFLLTSCAYRVGQKFRTLPGGYRKLSIPVVKNKSMEPGAEAIITHALKEEFFRSTVLKVVNDSEAEVRLEGQIDSLYFDQQASFLEASAGNHLPTGTVLTTGYSMSIIMTMKLIKTATSEVIWQSQFSSGRPMTSSQVQTAGVNSVNPIYNQNAKRLIIESISYEISNQIHNNLTENF